MGVTNQAHNRTMTAKAPGNGARAWNGGSTRDINRRVRPARPKKMVTEMWGEEPYTFYPLAEHIVADREICSGEPTFKYTRILAFYALDLLAAGWTVQGIVNEWWAGRVSAEAIQEAVRLAAMALDESLAALSRAG